MDTSTHTPESPVLSTVRETLLQQFGQEVEQTSNINWERKTEEFIDALQKNGIYVSRRA